MQREKLKIHYVKELCGQKPNTSINKKRIIDKKLKGKVKAIKIENFTTFSKQWYYPGAYLNVLVGPNGTGKSTMVSALILGMGGAPMILGRGNAIQDFIQNGKEQATIKIYLHRMVDVDVEFTRSFNIDGKNTFLIDGITCSERDYIREITEYGIQINNLCTFLPQDRVQDFAKLNNLELFKSTLKTICDSELYEAYENLVMLRNKQNNVMKENEKMMVKLREISLKIDGMKAQVQVIIERERLVKQLALIKCKLAWKQFENAMADIKQLKKLLEKAQLQLNANEELLAPLLTAKKDVQTVANQLKHSMEAIELVKRKGETQLKNLINEMESFERAMNKAKAELNSIKIEMLQYAKTLEALNFQKDHLLEIRHKSLTHGDTEYLESRIAVFDKESTRIIKQVDELVMCKNRLLRQTTEEYHDTMKKVDLKLAGFTNNEGKKLQFLKAANSDAFQAALWLEDNEHRLKGKVYRPLMLEISVCEESYIKYFENVISTRDSFALICECTDDMEFLMEELSHKQGLKLNFIHSDPDLVYSPPHRIPIEQLNQFGFYTYMSSLIAGPAPVLNFLFKTYRMETIPIGNDFTYALDENTQLPRHISMYFSTNHRFEIHKSHYSTTISTASREIKRRHVLPNVFQDHSEAVDLVLRERSKLEDKQKVKLYEYQQILRMIDKYYRKNEELILKTNKYKGYIQAVRIAEKNLNDHLSNMKRLIENPIDLPLEQKKFIKKINDIHQRLMAVHKKKINLFKLLTQNSIKMDCECSKMKIIERKLTVMDSEMHEIQNDVEQSKTKVKELTDLLNGDEQKADELEQIALALSDSFKPNDKNYPDKKEYMALPNTFESLTDRSREITGSLSCMANFQPDVIIEYEKQLALENGIQEKINGNATANSTIDESIKKIHVLWCQAIRQNINIINKNYAKFMAAMGYSGEVTLVRKNERDYQDYGIQLMVKFRDKEPLKPLDRYVQSGGERAVATAIYTLATQQVASVPFRCVDEINQGMDPKNETKIFNMLVEETAKPSEAQYFFVTPKPIDDLNSNDDVTISIVYNSSMLYNTSCFPGF